MNGKYLIFTGLLLLILFQFGEVFGTQYFPEDLDMPARLREIQIPLYSGILGAMREPALWPLTKDRNVVSCRLFYLPARGEPVVLRLNRTGLKRWTLTAKLAARSFANSALAVNKKVNLSEDKVEEYLKLFNSLRFWQLPTVGAIEQEINLFGGTSCILEAVESGRYHLVVRRSPKDSDKRWIADPHMAKELQELKEKEGFPDIDRVTSEETNKKLVTVAECLMRLSGLKLEVQ
jgi:hypothetical protein